MTRWLQSGNYRRSIRGGRGSSSGSTNATADRKTLEKRNIVISDRFFYPDVNETLREQYFEGLMEISKDFPIDSLTVEIGKTKKDVVGYSTFYFDNGTKKGKIVISEDFITGKESYHKGSLAWHSAHEYAHQIQDALMSKAWKRGDYPNLKKFMTDTSNGTTVSKSILLDANKKANKIEGVNKTVYERLQSISDYANPKNKWAKSTWREGHSETIGKYVHNKKNKSDVFGRIVYEETLRRYKL